MARAKMTGYDRRVTVGADGAQTWETGDLLWQWRNEMGVNLHVRISGQWHATVYAKNLREAGAFAEGFVMGVDGARCAQGK